MLSDRNAHPGGQVSKFHNARAAVDNASHADAQALDVVLPVFLAEAPNRACGGLQQLVWRGRRADRQGFEDLPGKRGARDADLAAADLDPQTDVPLGQPESSARPAAGRIFGAVLAYDLAPDQLRRNSRNASFRQAALPRDIRARH
jgi:hypothetical protein